MHKDGRAIIFAGFFLTSFAAPSPLAMAMADSPAMIQLAPGAMPRIARVDERYQSYNIEMAEIVGAKFWKPYSQEAKSTASGGAAAKSGTPVMQIGRDSTMFEARPPLNLYNERLRELAAALGPAYMRVSGTWANSVYFQDSGNAATAAPPSGFQSVLTRPEWRGVAAFSHAVNAKIVTSFSISAGVRNAAGVWTPAQAQQFLDYNKAISGDIAAAEFFNEPSLAAIGSAPTGYDAQDYARDFAVFRAYAKKKAPGMLIVGPGSVGEGISLMPGHVLKTSDLLAASPRPVFDIFSYHSYAAVSERCSSFGNGVEGTTADNALSEDWLARPDKIYAFYGALRDRFEPGKPIWITETADAGCGGNPWASTFLDSFRYLDQLGSLAKLDVQVVFHNTLDSSDYGLIDQATLTPRPNYWAALLWHRLMGTTVLDAGANRPGLHLYAQCLLRHPGGVALLAINLSRTNTAVIDVLASAERYTLSAKALQSSQVQLNGQDLKLTANGDLPSLQGTDSAPGQISFAPATITFLAITDAKNVNCQ